MPEREENRLRARIAEELDLLRKITQLRTLETPAGINFCSNDYLGLSTDPRLKHAVLEAVEQTASVGSTGSRLLSGNAKEWEEAESDFAKFIGAEAALYFGSGYAANVGMFSSLLKPGDLVFTDDLNHASIIDGIRLSKATKIIYPHCDLQFLEDALRNHRQDASAKIIVTESLFSMEGDIAPIGDLLGLAKSYGAELVVDEAHAIGVYGPQGRGIVAELKLEKEILASVYPCGKALASSGAFVCCSEMLKHYLINRARSFIFSTAMPPYLARQIQAALGLVREADAERTHLQAMAFRLRQTLEAAGYNLGSGKTHIVPVILGSNELALHAAHQLQTNGFAVKAIRPPSVPPGTARLRLSLTSQITAEDIARLAEGIDAACKSFAKFSEASAQHA